MGYKHHTCEVHLRPTISFSKTHNDTFYQDFDAELDSEEFPTEDEFFYGDEFVPENQDEIKIEPSVDESFEENVFSENTDVELENEPELVFSDEFIFDDLN